MGKSFIDTNVIVYANDAADADKQGRAVEVVRELLESGGGVISTQVLMEYAAVATHKLGQSRAAVSRQIVNLERMEVVPVGAELIREGLEMAESHTLSSWDGVIIAAAAAAQCTEIISEGFSHGTRLAGVRVRNPFLQDA
jgi:predicted nucleic acid-binding protein